MFRLEKNYWLKIKVNTSVIFCFVVLFIITGCGWIKTESPVVFEKEFDTETGTYVDTGVGLIISIPPASVAGRAKLQVVYSPSSEQIGEGALQLISIYDVNITPLAVEEEYQYPLITLSFEIPKDVDPRSVAILEWKDKGWVLAENEEGPPGGSVSAGTSHVSIVRKSLSRFSPATWSWLYKHIFYHLEKLPQPPPPDPKITVGMPEKTDGSIIVPVSLVSPAPIPPDIPLIGGVGGMWYCIEVREEWGVIKTEIKGSNVLKPGDNRDVKITFRNTGGEATIYLRFKKLQVCPLGRAAINWLSRLGIPVEEDEIKAINKIVGLMELLIKTYERSAKQWLGFKDVVWIIKEFLIKEFWKAVGPVAKFYANLIPVAVDIATYINAFVDRAEPFQKIIFYPNNPPKADFTFFPSNPKVNETIKFYDRSVDQDNDIMIWNWDFGDGSTSTIQNPSHNYKQVGTYTVRLMVMDSKGNKDTASKVVSVVSSSSLEPRVSVYPSSGAPGTKFHVQWEGFTPNSTLTSHLQKPDGTEFPTKKFSTDSKGEASHIIDSTGFSPGTYTLWAIDDATGIRTVNTAIFTITKEVTLTPKVTVSPLSGPAGTQFDVLWEGFTPNNTLISHLKKPDGTEFPTKIFYTDSRGRATHTIDSTGFKPGTYELWGVDNATGTRTVNTASFTILAPTTGTIRVIATFDGKPWEGSIAIKLIAPNGWIDYLSVHVPWEQSGFMPGTWTLEFRSGGPEGGILKDITPSSTQTLSAGGTITFTLNFVKGGPPDMPDLWVEDIWTVPESFTCGDTVKIGVMVRNEGMGDAVGVFRTCLYLDGNLIGCHDQNGLAGGRSLGAPYGDFFVWEQTLLWPNDGDYHTLKAVVDVNNVIEESNENNNVLSVQFKAACAESTIETTGTVVFVGLNGGFFGILGDDGKRYEPINLPSDCEVVGLRVWFKARILQRTIHMWGIPIEIIEIVPFPPDGFLSYRTVGCLLPLKRVEQHFCAN